MVLDRRCRASLFRVQMRADEKLQESFHDAWLVVQRGGLLQDQVGIVRSSGEIHSPVCLLACM